MKKLLILLFLFASIKALAQNDRSDLASNAFQNGKWSDAVKLFKAYRVGHATDNNSLYFIGSSEIHLADYKMAVIYLDSAYLFSGSPKRFE